MKYLAITEGYRPREFEALDEEDAAEKMAELAWDDSAGEMSTDDGIDVTVMAPDGTTTRHLVSAEAVMSFTAWVHDDEPDESVVAELRAAAGAR